MEREARPAMYVAPQERIIIAVLIGVPGCMEETLPTVAILLFRREIIAMLLCLTP